MAFMPLMVWYAKPTTRLFFVFVYIVFTIPGSRPTGQFKPYKGLERTGWTGPVLEPHLVTNDLQL